jgi:hypothetical protein
VYRVVFACPCGASTSALVGHDALDWAPLGLGRGLTYVNLMTSRRDDACRRADGPRVARIGRGEWPWCFFCYLEDAPRPVTPSAFRLLAPCAATVAVAVRCPSAARRPSTSCQPPHVDVPFHSDATVGVVAHAFDEALAARSTLPRRARLCVVRREAAGASMGEAPFPPGRDDGDASRPILGA